MSYKNLRQYRSKIAKAFENAGGINRLTELMRDDDVFLDLTGKFIKMLPRELDVSGEIDGQIVVKFLGLPMPSHEKLTYSKPIIDVTPDSITPCASGTPDATPEPPHIERLAPNIKDYDKGAVREQKEGSC